MKYKKLLFTFLFLTYFFIFSSYLLIYLLIKKKKKTFSLHWKKVIDTKKQIIYINTKKIIKKGIFFFKKQEINIEIKKV